MSDSDKIGNNQSGQHSQAYEDRLEFSEEEEALITRMFSLVGPRWSLIAGRIPGRTAQEIEKYWTSKRTSYVNHNNPE